MIVRTITGACYVAFLVCFFLLRRFVDVWTFQILCGIFCTIGTFELARALKPYAIKNWNFVSVIFGALFVPQYCIFEYVFFKGYGFVFALGLSLLFIIASLIAYAFSDKNGFVDGNAEIKGFSKFFATVLPFLYPSLLLLTTVLANDLSYDVGHVALLLIFIIPAASDTMAYLVGMIYNKIRKGKAKKLCPKLSPKKTVAGGIGGIVGGIIASLIVYFIIGKDVANIFIFIAVGLVAAVLTEIGDLFESFIKRRVGIKDMGKLMPGHGGIMDRIDGMSFASVVIYLVFLLV